MKTKLYENPWQKDLTYPVWRFLWILFSLFILPSILTAAGTREALGMLISTLAAIPACISGKDELGIRKLTVADWFIVPGFYVAIMLLTALPSVCWKAALEAMNTNFPEKQGILDLIRDASFQDRIYMFMSICAVTPVVEEVAFRRIVFSWLKKNGKSAVPAIFITSLLFSIAHFFVMGIPGLFIMGAGFQLIYLLRKNLLSAILLHSLINTVAFMANFYKFNEFL